MSPRTSKLKVRAFTLGDYEDVKKVWIESGLEIRPGDEAEGVKRKLRRDRDLFLVAEESEKIVGSVMGAWDGRRGWIYHLGVLPSWQRHGVATMLVEELEARMKKMGIPKVNALIYPWNDRSVRFFAHAGYSVEEMKEAQKWLKEGPRPVRRKRTDPRRVTPRPA